MSSLNLEPERRFAKGDVVLVTNPETAYCGDTATVVEHIYDDPYHYWVRVGDGFADLLPFKDEELERVDDGTNA